MTDAEIARKVLENIKEINEKYPNQICNHLVDENASFAPALARAVLRQGEACKWTYQDYENAWKTDCENIFCIIEGTPEDNEMKYCPYCGKRIEQSLGESQ